MTSAAWLVIALVLAVVSSSGLLIGIGLGAWMHLRKRRKP